MQPSSSAPTTTVCGFRSLLTDQAEASSNPECSKTNAARAGRSERASDAGISTAAMVLHGSSPADAASADVARTMAVLQQPSFCAVSAVFRRLDRCVSSLVPIMNTTRTTHLQRTEKAKDATFSHCTLIC